MLHPVAARQCGVRHSQPHLDGLQPGAVRQEVVELRDQLNSSDGQEAVEPGDQLNSSDGQEAVEPGDPPVDVGGHRFGQPPGGRVHRDQSRVGRYQDVRSRDGARLATERFG